MNLIDLFAVFFRFAISVGVGAGIATVSNVYAGFVSGALFWGTFPWLIDLLPGGKGSPPCPDMVCTPEDYVWIGGFEDCLVCQCKCGTKFVHRGHSFDILNEDGSTAPYRKWKRRKGWIPVSEA